MTNGRLDVLDDVVRHVELPGGIIERLGIFDQRFVIKESFDRRAPEEWAETHLGGPFRDSGSDVGRKLRRRGQAGVFKIIHSDGKSATNFIRAMRMRDDR